MDRPLDLKVAMIGGTDFMDLFFYEKVEQTYVMGVRNIFYEFTKFSIKTVICTFCLLRNGDALIVRWRWRIPLPV